MNTLRDVLEDYNIVQEFPSLMEAGTELLQHSLYYRNGKWNYALNGMLSCLSDGLTKDNRNWVRAMWDFVLSKSAVKSHPGAAVVFSQAMLERELDAYLVERFTSSWHLHWLLLGSGAALNSIVPICEVKNLPQTLPLVVLNSRFLPEDERKIIEAHPGKKLYIDAIERCAPELNDPPFFIGALQEPIPSDEQITAWAQEISAMTPNVPQAVAEGYHVFEETLTDGEKLITVFNDLLYCRHVPIKLPAPFEQVTPIKNHLMPPFITAADTFSIHLPPFGVVALKIRGE